jgi:hypothetical protein
MCKTTKSLYVISLLFFFQEAWRSISSVTIHTCFQNTAFFQSFQASTVPPVQRGIEPLPRDFLHLIQEAGRVFRFTPMSPDVYAEFDSQLQCHGSDMEEWEASLLAEATSSPLLSIKKEPDTDPTSSQAIESFHSVSRSEHVRPSEALECLSKLKRFSSSNIGLLTTVFEMESLILDSLGTSLV